MSGYTLTPNFALYKPVVGADEDVWGAQLNLNADTLDTLIKGYLPLSGGTVIGATAFSPPPLISDGSAHTAPPAIVFPTVAAMSAFNYSTASSAFVVSCQGYLAAGDGGGGDFAYIPAITKTTSAQTTAGAVLPLTSTSSLAVGQIVQGTGIAPHTFITKIVANTSVTMSKSVSGTVASGATITFQAGDVDGAFTYTANSGVLRRLLQGRSLTCEQAGLRGDYIMPQPYTTNALTAAAGTTISFADTSGIQVGWWAHHPSLPFGTTVSSLTATSVTVNNPVGALGIASSDMVMFNPVATDNTNQLTTIANALNGAGYELIVSADKYYYFGIGTNTTPILPQFLHIRGQSPNWGGGRAPGLAAFSCGIVLHPMAYIRMNSVTRLSNVCIIRAGLPVSAPNMQTYTKIIDQLVSENGVIANPLVLNTSATTASGSVLTFASTTGVTVGMYGTAPNFLDAMRVTGVTATTVTFLGNILGQIIAGTPISFGRNYRSIGIWLNQSDMELDHVYIMGFNTGVLGTSGGHRMNHVFSDCINGFDISGDGMGTAHSNLRAALDWSGGVTGGFTSTMNICTAVAVANGGIGHQVGDLLLDELSTLVQVTAIGAGGTITQVGPPIWRGGCWRTPPATTATRCLTRDPQGSNGCGGGMGTGATLATTFTAFPSMSGNYVPSGRGYYLHDRVDNCIFTDCFAAGHQYGWIISNCWLTTVRGGYEGRIGNSLNSGSVGMWAWNTPSWCSIEAPYIGGSEYPLLFQNVDAHNATIYPKLGQGAVSFARLLGGQIGAVGSTALGNQAPQPAITIDTGSRGIIDGGTNVYGSGPSATDPVMRVNANVLDWKICNVFAATEAGANTFNWIAVDPTSEARVTIANCRAQPRLETVNPMTDGPLRPGFAGPADRLLYPQHFIYDPTAGTPIDGSPSAPLTVQSLEGGSAASRNVLLSRGGSVRGPAIVGFLGTTGTGPVLDAVPGTMLITTATVPPGGGGVGYWPGDVIYDPDGGAWAAATVDAVGQILTVTNKWPATYTGAAPTNPVTTRTEAKGGYSGSVNLGLSGGGVTASVPIAIGSHYYAGTTSLLIGVPGQYTALGGITWLAGSNLAGTQAAGTLTIAANGQITGVTMTTPGSGYTGVPPTIQVVATPPSGCTLNLGVGVPADTVMINPSGGPTKIGGAIVSPLLTNAANDAAAASAGVAVGQWYRNGSALMQRIA